MRQTDTGALIAQLRKEQGLTQKQQAEQLHISDRTISKWERGECLPDTGLLLDLAEVLETNADSLLRGGEPVLTFAGRIRVEDILQGMEGFFAFPRLVGKNNTLYQGMIEGINRRMNLDWEEDLKGREER